MDIQPHDIKLVEYVTLLHENRDSVLVKTMIALFDEVIEKARRDNDDAVGEFVQLNQGIIRGMKQIKDYLSKGLPKRMVQ